MPEKRKHKRMDIDVSIELEQLTEDGISMLEYATVQACNISRGGIGFISRQRLEEGSYYDAKIQIRNGDALNTVLEINRREENEGEYKYGAVFIGMSDADAAKIDVYQVFQDL